MHWSWWDVQALPVEVYDTLIEMINEGDLKPGLGD